MACERGASSKTMWSVRMTDSVLIVEREGPVARVTMNRPNQLNALDSTLIAELHEFFAQLRNDLSTRVVILQGAGRAFCCGLDLKEQLARPVHGDPLAALALQQSVRDIMLAMRRCPQPIIGIVQGAASGGGFALALACDVRLITPDARMNASFIKVGLTGCDIGVSWFLTRMAGSSVAAELLLTGRFLDAQRALGLGLVSRVAALAELQAESVALANEMLATSAIGLRLTKDGLNMAIDGSSLEAVIALEDRQQVLCTQTPEFLEAVRAFVEKRAPDYVQKITGPVGPGDRG